VPYKPIPVSVAQQIGDGHQKDIVLIVGWDDDSNKTNIVTWGREPTQKAAAAKAGEMIAGQLGLVDDLVDVHEDFRREGEAAKEVDRLRAAIGKAVRGLRAEIVDETQDSAETLGKIEMRVDELADVLSVTVSR
jgi:hypothetical protein